jgi:hypothetical protein
MFVCKFLAQYNLFSLSLAAMLIDFWSAEKLEVKYIDSELIWHDLYCHFIPGNGVDLVGETRAQVVQQTLSDRHCSVGTLQAYWREQHNMVLLTETAESLLEEMLPYANEVTLFSQNNYSFHILEDMRLREYILEIIYGPSPF